MDSNDQHETNRGLPTPHSFKWCSWPLEFLRKGCRDPYIRATTLAVIALTGVLIILKKRKPNKERASKTVGKKLKYQRSLSMASLHGGRFALQRLVMAHHAKFNPNVLAAATEQFMELLKEDLPNITELQSLASILEMSGKEEEVIRMLREALQRVRKEGRALETHELEMLLVEMLIYEAKQYIAVDFKNVVFISELERLGYPMQVKGQYCEPIHLSTASGRTSRLRWKASYMAINRKAKARNPRPKAQEEPKVLKARRHVIRR
ncbi:hypothetical protein AMTR_s00096p00163200 [Amborella trichopoda]|uniref:Uncharacterized protein n=1 Tax=Amborella trichopoda TaxID=13333 RepID=W1P645_AMBTC|nr:hypothetical protein AMTR_s00096p00163200 [Amborella trichopoda]